jgi:hypothetical protein
MVMLLLLLLWLRLLLVLLVVVVAAVAAIAIVATTAVSAFDGAVEVFVFYSRTLVLLFVLGACCHHCGYCLVYLFFLSPPLVSVPCRLAATCFSDRGSVPFR